MAPKSDAKIKIKSVEWRDGKVFARLDDGSEHELQPEPLTAKEQAERRQHLKRELPDLCHRVSAMVAATACTPEQGAALRELASCTDTARVAALTELVGEDLHYHRWALIHAARAEAALKAGDDDEAAEQQGYAEHCLAMIASGNPAEDAR